MKKGLLTIMVVALLASGCGGKMGELGKKKGSSGKTLELMVVADRNVYGERIKGVVEELWGSPQTGLPQPEKKFDLVNVPRSSFEEVEMFKVHRNVVILDINEANENKVYKHIDEYAVPQVIFDFAAKSTKDLDSLLRHYAPMVEEEFYAAEHRRIWKAYTEEEGYEVEASVKEAMGIGLKLSQSYGLASKGKDFVWVKMEAKDFGMGVLVNRYDYKESGMFEEERILDSLDTMMQRWVPGPSEGSYMGIERRKDKESGEWLLPIESKVVEFEGSSYCVETRGCWRLFGNFMGGPFVSYTLLTPDKKQIMSLTGYVYCPRNKPYTKRDLLMQVESVCHSLKFE